VKWTVRAAATHEGDIKGQRRCVRTSKDNEARLRSEVHVVPDAERGHFRAATVFERNAMLVFNDHFDFIEEALRKFI
jgi:hypothetical protein